MIKADFHVHTEFSNDCYVKIEHQIESAMKLGLDFICITDHCDMHLFPKEKYALDTHDYIRKVNILKENYNKQIKVLCGVELGLMPSLKEKIGDYVSRYDFDFIIGSSHAVNGIDIGYNVDEYFKGKSEKQAYTEYFESILENVKTFSCYDVYGHLDYVVRYGPNKNKYFDFNDYKDVFEELLKIIIQNGKGIEINTGAFRKNLECPHPHKDILKMYKDLGGQIITIGSDAHLPEHVGYKFQDVQELLRSLGFKSYAIFENKVPKFIKL